MTSLIAYVFLAKQQSRKAIIHTLLIALYMIRGQVCLLLGSKFQIFSILSPCREISRLLLGSRGL